MREVTEEAKLTDEPFDENAPLSNDELQRLEHNALAMVAREYMTACPQCELEAPLVVRAMTELRRLRDAPLAHFGEPLRIDCPVPDQCVNGPDPHTHAR